MKTLIPTLLLVALVGQAAHGQTGACCLADGTCVVATEEECTGELWHEGEACDPNPCIGVCCLPVAPWTCTLTVAVDCPVGNIWSLGYECEPVNPCVVPGSPGACCLIGGACVMLTSEECGAHPDYCYFAGPEHLCDSPGLCDECINAVRAMTWGQIRAIYR